MDAIELQRPGDCASTSSTSSGDGRRYEVVDGLLVVSPRPDVLAPGLGAALLRQLSDRGPDDWRVLLVLGPAARGRRDVCRDLSVVSARAPLGPGAPLPGPSTSAWCRGRQPSSRKTDRFAKPGEYAEAGIPLFWRVETEPDLLVVAHRLRVGVYEQVAVVDGTGSAPAPWGAVQLDLTRIGA
jgi:hypothetical protein